MIAPNKIVSVFRTKVAVSAENREDALFLLSMRNLIHG